MDKYGNRRQTLEFLSQIVFLQGSREYCWNSLSMDLIFGKFFKKITQMRLSNCRQSDQNYDVCAKYEGETAVLGGKLYSLHNHFFSHQWEQYTHITTQNKLCFFLLTSKM